MASKPKSTDAAYIARVSAVAEMVLDGYSLDEMTREGADKWGVGQRQIHRYLHEAKQIIRANAEAKADAQFDVAVGRLDKIYRKALEAKRYMIALDTAKEIHALYGLYPAKQVDVSIAVKDMSDEELARSTAEIEAYLQGCADGSGSAVPGKARTGRKGK